MHKEELRKPELIRVYAHTVSQLTVFCIAILMQLNINLLHV